MSADLDYAAGKIADAIGRSAIDLEDIEASLRALPEEIAALGELIQGLTDVHLAGLLAAHPQQDVATYGRYQLMAMGRSMRERLGS